jgi:hypothetical protein
LIDFITKQEWMYHTIFSEDSNTIFHHGLKNLFQTDKRFIKQDPRLSLRSALINT